MFFSFFFPKALASFPLSRPNPSQQFCAEDVAPENLFASIALQHNGGTPGNKKVLENLHDLSRPTP